VTTAGCTPVRWLVAAMAWALGSYLKKSALSRLAASCGPMVAMSGTWQEMQRSTRKVSPCLACGNDGKSCWVLTSISFDDAG
jgi:hypothetical protein